jgi:glutathione synthase/RimK-type ligase-like ATP-grasp enzyme
VSAREALALDEDMPPLLEALAARGAQVETPSWDDAAVDWSRFDIAVLRSTWDYVDRIDEFLAWAGRCQGLTTLLNAPAILRWNTDKHYLWALAASGVPVVPTRFVEPGEDVDAGFDRFLAGGVNAVGVGACEPFAEFVVKPAIGAGSRDAARYRRTDAPTAREHLRRLVATERRSALLQPYLDRVDHYGETAVIYLGGRYSHAIRKGPLLRVGDGLVAGLFAPEEISRREPDAEELRVAAAAYAVVPGEAPLYARVDLIRDGAGRPVVLELELTEPSLFLLHDSAAAGALAQAILLRALAGGAQNQPE